MRLARYLEIQAKILHVPPQTRRPDRFTWTIITSQEWWDPEPLGRLARPLPIYAYNGQHGADQS